MAKIREIYPNPKQKHIAFSGAFFSGVYFAIAFYLTALTGLNL
jgi:hypothetical protein